MLKLNKKTIIDTAENLGISAKWINKYVLVTLCFIVWLAFFDKHNIFTYQKLKNTIAKMELEKENLNKEIAQALKDREDLKNNHEKFAREKHLMHKVDEEIILIEKQNIK